MRCEAAWCRAISSFAPPADRARSARSRKTLDAHFAHLIVHDCCISRAIGMPAGAGRTHGSRGKEAFSPNSVILTLRRSGEDSRLG